jgi:hypothetical protein
MPALQYSVLSSVAVVVMGKASGVFNMGRFLGGVFGVALLVAMFSAGNTSHSPENFSNGFAGAMKVAAALSLLGVIAGLWLPPRLRPTALQIPQNA